MKTSCRTMVLEYYYTYKEVSYIKRFYKASYWPNDSLKCAEQSYTTAQSICLLLKNAVAVKTSARTTPTF